MPARLQPLSLWLSCMTIRASAGSVSKEPIVTIIKDFTRKYPVSIYFILTFIISWGAILIFAGPGGIPATKELIMVLGMAMLLGPSAASILLTGLVSGRKGYRELVTRLLRWRVGIRWYAAALLTAPLATAAALLLLWVFSEGSGVVRSGR